MTEQLSNWVPDDDGAHFDGDSFDELDGPLMAEPPHPINWNQLTADEAETEWGELNRWVNWLRRTYGLPASVVPPFWHRHPEFVWELSALHLHWLCAYDPDQHGSAPFGWHRDFADARQRLHDWVATSGTRLDRDRPTRQTAWPGEPSVDMVEDAVIRDRDADFVRFVISDVARRRQAEADLYAAKRSNPPKRNLSDTFFSTAVQGCTVMPVCTKMPYANPSEALKARSFCVGTDIPNSPASTGVQLAGAGTQ